MSKKANKRLFALRLLTKSGATPDDLVKIYCSLIRSVLEHASPVWAVLPDYLDNMQCTELQDLSARRMEAWRKFLPALYQITICPSMGTALDPVLAASKRFRDIVTVKYLV